MIPTTVSEKEKVRAVNSCVGCVGCGALSAGDGSAGASVPPLVCAGLERGVLASVSTEEARRKPPPVHWRDPSMPSQWAVVSVVKQRFRMVLMVVL